jgi:hypothetical protein
MLKLSKRQSQKLLKISNRYNSDKILEMKRRVKSDPVVIKKFKEYGVSIADIDKVHVEFCSLDVSAKTKDRKIYINENMLEDGAQDPTHYLVHELTHYLQQSKNVNRINNNTDQYLEKPTEEEAFRAQIEFKKKHDGEDEAEKYTENLLDYHNYDGKKRKEKKKELLE